MFCLVIDDYFRIKLWLLLTNNLKYKHRMLDNKITMLSITDIVPNINNMVNWIIVYSLFEKIKDLQK